MGVVLVVGILALAGCAPLSDAQVLEPISYGRSYDLYDGYESHFRDTSGRSGLRWPKTFDTLPALEGAFDNWGGDIDDAVYVGCRSLVFRMKNLQLPSVVMKKLIASKEFRQAKKDGFDKSGELYTWCAPTRQDPKRPRCFSDFGKYQLLAVSKLPANLLGANPRKGPQSTLQALETKHVATNLKSDRGHNSAQCFVALSHLRSPEEAALKSLMAFRARIGYPKSARGWGDADGKYVEPEVHEPSPRALLRSLSFRAPLTNWDLVPRLEREGRSTPNLKSIISAANALRSTGAFKSDKHSPVWDNLIGRVVGSVEGAKLRCKHYQVETPAFQNSLNSFHRMSFDPMPESPNGKPRPTMTLDRCPLILAHRAVTSASSAEGSFESTENIARGKVPVDGVEIDLFLFKGTVFEGRGEQREKTELVVSHDASLERIIGVPGELQDMLKNMAAKMIEQVTGCGVMTPLTQYLDVALKYPHFKMDLEMKPGSALESPFSGYREAMGRELGRLLRTNKYRPLWQDRDQLVVSSFDPKKTEYVNEPYAKDRQRHGIVRTARARHIGSAAWLNHALLNNRWLKDEYVTAEMMHYSLITKELVSKYHAEGKAVGTYTLFDMTEPPTGASYKQETVQRLVEAGVDWIETDAPARLRAMLSEVHPEKCPPLVTDLPETQANTDKHLQFFKEHRSLKPLYKEHMWKGNLGNTA